MIRYSEKDGVVTFAVRVVPRASQSEIAGEYNGALRVRVAAPPVDGAANEEMIQTLARALNVPRKMVEIASGIHSKNKTIRVRNADESVVEKLITNAR